MRNVQHIERLLGQLVEGQENLKSLLERHFEEDRELAKRVTRIEGTLKWWGGVLATIVFLWGALSDTILKAIGLKS